MTHQQGSHAGARCQGEGSIAAARPSWPQLPLRSRLCKKTSAWGNRNGTQRREQLPDPLGEEPAMPGGQLSRKRGGGGAHNQGLQGRVRWKRSAEEPGAQVTRQPNDAVPGVLSAGFKLREAEPFPRSRARGFARGGCRCGTAALQPQVEGFPRAPREGGHRYFCQGALPVSQLPQQLGTTLLALLSSQLSFSASVIAVIFAHAEHHHTASLHHSRRQDREEVRDVPRAVPGPKAPGAAPTAVPGSSQW